ncbi:MAG TPA: DUF4157 domain-containing protein [Acidimicrobiales bacterium]
MRDLEVEQRSAKRVATNEAEAGPKSALPARVASPDHQHVGPAQVASLQRLAGNAAVAQFLSGDGAEEMGEHETEEHQGAPGASVHDVLASDHGRPLDVSTKAQMEPAFGRSFDSVRVHDGDRAASSAQELGAQAYTVGRDIVLGQGHPDLGSDAGAHVLAHELTHVVQQEHGPVDGTSIGGGVAVSDPSDSFEREAEHTAESVMRGGSAVSPSHGAPQGGGEATGASVQRLAGENEGEESEGAEGGRAPAAHEQEGDESEGEG